MAHHSDKDILKNHPGLHENLMKGSLARLQEQLKDHRAEGVGATGRHPEGHLGEQDEGEIQFAIAADKKGGKVLIDFGKPVAWVGMSAQQARELGVTLCRKAGDVDGKITRVTFE